MAGQSKDIETIYNAALQKASETERNAYLEKACGDDQVLRARVETLLRAHEQAGDFLESSAIEPGMTLDSSPAREGPGTKIGHYELLELIGEGGMGLVYLAEQKEPVRRKVVLKIVKPGMDSKQVIARFEAERQVLAILDHPNIAHVFDAGTTETGRPYFVMEYVKGMSITRYCDEKKLSIEKRLRLFEQVCEGIHHAHQKGIIHRDIKPSNILISVHGDKAVPKIIDFGIAKAITQPLTDKTFVTFQGQLLGTPEYMSPEQVDLATQDIDTRSDIYSLGVVLYELLAGVLPFEEESFGRRGFSEIQRTIREVEPASPSIRLTSLGEKAKTIAASRGTQVVPLARRLHRELEWIPLKAMRKDRCRRYRSASEMADDVRNYLNGLPLIAGPETAIYRVQKFVRKHAGSVATVALIAATIVIGLIVSIAMYFRAESMRAQAEQAREKETIARTQAENAERATKQKAEELRWSNYVNTIQLADAKHREGNARQVRELLDSCPEDLRGWEWNRLDYIHDQSLMTFVANHGRIFAAIFSPDGRRIITSGSDKTIRMWDSETGKELNVLQGHEDIIEDLDISPDGKRIVSGSDDKTIKLWNAQTGIEIATLRGHQYWVTSVAFSPDGSKIVSGSGDGTMKLWDAQSCNELITLKAHQEWIDAVIFSPDGKYIVSCSDDNTIKLWDAETGTAVATFTGHQHSIMSVAFSPDGKKLVSGSKDKTVKVWDVLTGVAMITIPSHDGQVWSVAFSPNGEFIASGGADNTVRIWDAETGNELKKFRGHNWIIASVQFSPDGKHLVSASLDDTVKLWDVTIDRELTKYPGHSDITWSIAFSKDGKIIISGSADSTIKLWDTQTGEELKTILGRVHYPSSAFSVSSVAFSPDGKCIASGARLDKTIRLWDASTGIELMALRGHKDGIGSVAFSPSGSYIASGSKDKTIKLWDVSSGTEIMTLQGHENAVRSVSFSPDGKQLVSGSVDKTIKLWDLSSQRELMTFRGHEGNVWCVTFSPDGKRIASASVDRTAKIWDAATGAELITLQGHRDILSSVKFSPDGKRLITAGRDAIARLWDSATGAELMTLRADSPILCVAFSPDGKTIAASTSDGYLLLWESTAPAGGYEPRRNAEEARRLVERLYRKYGFYHDVISQLQSDATIEPSFRKIASHIANSHRWEDGDKLMKEARETVISSDRSIEEYQTALEKASKANSWEPNDPAILNTLGAAQYRLDSYEEALNTLVRSAQLLSAAGEEPDPVNIAFTAMTVHQIGRSDEAKAALKQLRELCKDWPFDEDMEFQALLAEAEQLITGEEKY
jgi:WD40 repeat protein/serine/threonine protein kinase